MEPPSKKRRVEIIKNEVDPLAVIVKLEILERKLDLILLKLNNINNGNSELQMNYIS
jgi:hypothetical protein